MEVREYRAITNNDVAVGSGTDNNATMQLRIPANARNCRLRSVICSQRGIDSVTGQALADHQIYSFLKFSSAQIPQADNVTQSADIRIPLRDGEQVFLNFALEGNINIDMHTIATSANAVTYDSFCLMEISYEIN
jgi:hypothetical protein